MNYINKIEEENKKLKDKVLYLETLLDSKDSDLSDMEKEKGKLKKVTDSLSAYIINAQSFTYTTKDGVSVDLKEGSVLLLNDEEYKRIEAQYGEYTTGKKVLDETYLVKVDFYID